MDATPVDLCLSLFPWASLRKAKGGIKLHAAMNHNGNLPKFVTVTDARQHEVSRGRCVEFPKSSIVAFDRAYTDDEWYKSLTDNGIFFVARLKYNATTRVMECREVNRTSDQTRGQIIKFTRGTSSRRCPTARRRI